MFGVKQQSKVKSSGYEHGKTTNWKAQGEAVSVDLVGVKAWLANIAGEWVKFQDSLAGLMALVQTVPVVGDTPGQREKFRKRRDVLVEEGRRLAGLQIPKLKE